MIYWGDPAQNPDSNLGNIVQGRGGEALGPDGITGRIVGNSETIVGCYLVEWWAFHRSESFSRRERGRRVKFTSL